MVRHNRELPLGPANGGRWIPALLLVGLIAAGSSVGAKILILAPHPDDDATTTAGVIYKAVLRGEPTEVVFLTNGDLHGMSIGLSRDDEAVSALRDQLGMIETATVFLGYPDGYMDVLYSNPSCANAGDVCVGPIGISATYAQRGLGLTDYHNFRFGSHASYNRANVVADLRDILASFQPDHIFVTAPPDTHADHMAAYQFLSLALAAVFPIYPNYNPTVHRTIVHGETGWPNGLDPGAAFTETTTLSGAGLLWSQRESLDVALPLQSLLFYPGNVKYQAIAARRIEGGLNSLLGLFVHKDEISWTEQQRGTNQPPVVNAGLDQSVGEGTLVRLDGSASFDRNGDPVTYQWRQVAGPAVLLSSLTAAQPTFTAPSGFGSEQILAFELVVSDGTLTTLPDQVSVIVQSPLEPIYGQNVAPQATVLASSQVVGSEAIKAIDGVVDGYPGDSTKEWAASGQGTGAWIQLNWSSPVTIGRVILYDRPNGNDWILHGVLRFGDNTTVSVGPLDNWGRDTAYTFSPRTVTSLRLDIDQTGPSTQSIGLSELKVFQVTLPGGNRPPVAVAGPAQTAGEGAVVQLDGSLSNDPDSDPITYSWAQTGGTQVTLSNQTSARPTFTAPAGLFLNDVLTFRLIVNDGQVNSPTASVVVTIVASNPQPVSNIASLAVVTASSETPATGQLAVKAVDGVIDGYPGNPTREWATSGQKAGAWLNLAWSAAYTVNRIVLYDRPDTPDQILGGTILFNDGTTLPVGPLNNGGAATEYRFAIKAITSIRLTVTAVSATTENVGLAEIELYGFIDTCAGSNASACTALDQCHAAGTCDPGTGRCSNPTAIDRTPCNDGIACTAGDACTGGACVGTIITAPPETRDLGVAADKARYTWAAAADATRYDVVRGSTSAFPVGPGGGDEVCFDNLAGAALVDTAVPSPAQGFWYLSRGENACGIGTFGTQSDGSPRSATTCP